LLLNKQETIWQAWDFVNQHIARVIAQDAHLRVSFPEFTHKVKHKGSQDTPLEELLPHITTSLAQQKSITVYAHMEYCQHRCLYCHYPVIDGATPAFVGQSIDLLIQEIKSARKTLSFSQLPVSSLYIGGGTPTEASGEQLARLLGTLQENLDLSKVPEISIEGTPETYTEEKIRSLCDLGINRVSVGIQTLNPRLLREINRRHTPEQALQAITNLLQAGFTQVNADLIYGFPGQLISDFWDDLQAAIARNPTSITLYRLRLERNDELNTVLRRWFEDDPSPFPEPITLYTMQYVARQLLEAHGYHEGPSGWFSRLPQPIAVYQDRWVEQKTLVAFGWHVYAYARTYECHNHKKIGDYRAAVRAGILPMERGSIYTLEEQMERYIFFQFKSLFKIRFEGFRSVFGISLLDQPEWVARFSHLVDFGLATLTNEEVALTPAGMVLVEEIIR